MHSIATFQRSVCQNIAITITNRYAAFHQVIKTRIKRQICGYSAWKHTHPVCILTGPCRTFSIRLGFGLRLGLRSGLGVVCGVTTIILTVVSCGRVNNDRRLITITTPAEADHGP